MAGIAPTPTPTTYTDGALIRASDLNGLSTHFSGLFTRTMSGFRTRKPMCVVTLAAAGGVTANTLTLMSWGNELLDTDNMFTPSAPTVVTITTAGLYRLSHHVHWDTTLLTSGVRSSRIMVNGTNGNTNAVCKDVREPLPSGSAEGAATRGDRTMLLAAGATVYVGVLHTASGGVNLTTALGGCKLTVEFIAPYTG